MWQFKASPMGRLFPGQVIVYVVRLFMFFSHLYN
jgi:hypothetical protein